MMMHRQSVYTHVGNGFSVVLLIRNLLRVAMDIFVVIYKVHTPTNALFIKLDKVLKFTLKTHFDLLLHVSVYEHHQGAFNRAYLRLYLGSDSVKTTSLYVMWWRGCMPPRHHITYSDVVFFTES